MLSATKNHEDQPKVCERCGGKIKSVHPAFFYHDDTGAGAHVSRHIDCDMSQSDFLLKS